MRSHKQRMRSELDCVRHNNNNNNNNNNNHNHNNNNNNNHNHYNNHNNHKKGIPSLTATTIILLLPPLAARIRTKT